MKHILLFTLVIIFSTPVLFAQDVKLKTKERDETYEEFFVLKSDKKVKHGSYLKLTKPLLGILGPSFFSEIGNYSYGKKHGPWEHYYINCNQIEYKGFYNNGKKDSLWVYFYPENDIKKLKEVKTDAGTQVEIVNLNKRVRSQGKYKDDVKVGIWDFYDIEQRLIEKYDFSRGILLFHHRYDNLQNKPLTFIGGETEMNRVFNSLFDFQNTMKRLNNKLGLNSGVIIISVEVDKDGNIISKKVLTDELDNKKLLNRSLAFIDQLKNCWSPEFREGLPQNSEARIKFILDANRSHQSFINERWSGGKTTIEFEFKMELENML